MGSSGTLSRICILAIITICVVSLSCLDQNCVTCNTYIGDSAGNLVETCSECSSGFKLNSSNKCVDDEGLIIGIALGAVAAVVAQVACYVYCKLKYDHSNKKKTDISLEDIYKEDIDNQGKQEVVIDAEALSDSIKTEFKVYITHKCGICDEDKTSIKTECGHYFHFACFKEEIIKAPELCPRCTKRGVSPIKMICCKCLNKQRSLPIETITNFENFHEYICFVCKLKVKKEEQTKKWWKRCC